MINVSTVLLIVLLLVCSFLSDAICSKWVRIPLVILVVVLGMVLFGNPFKTHRARTVGTCVSKGLNADGSYSVRIRLEETGKPLFYREMHGFFPEGKTIVSRVEKGQPVVQERSTPPENRWEFLISTEKAFVPDECECSVVLFVSEPKPLDFDENGNCLHPPKSGSAARTVAREPDGTVVFTIGPEAFDRPAAYRHSTEIGLSVYFNGVSLGTVRKPPRGEETDESHAEGAEDETHAESAEFAESESHAESAEFAESESHAESAESAE